MAWDVAAYAIVIVCLTATAALIAAAAAVRRLIRRRKADWERLSREAEATLQQWRRLGREASETAELCRRSLEGFEAFAQGGRALGEAAQTAALAAADTVARWTERVQERIADMEERQTRRIGNALDWMDIGMNLWHSWSQRAASAPNGAVRPEGAESDADQRR